MHLYPLPWRLNLHHVEALWTTTQIHRSSPDWSLDLSVRVLTCLHAPFSSIVKTKPLPHQSTMNNHSDSYRSSPEQSLIVISVTIGKESPLTLIDYFNVKDFLTNRVHNFKLYKNFDTLMTNRCTFKNKNIHHVLSFCKWVTSILLLK